MIRGLIIFIFFLLLSSDFNGVGSISLSSKEAYTLQSVSPLLRIPTSLTRSLQLSTLLSLPYFFFLLYLLLFLLLEIQRPSQVTNCRISGRRPSRAEARPSILSPSAPSLSLCNFRRLVSLLENVGALEEHLTVSQRQGEMSSTITKEECHASRWGDGKKYKNKPQNWVDRLASRLVPV